MWSLWEQYFQFSWSYTQKTIGSWSITSYLYFCLYLLEHKSVRALSHSCSLDLSCKHSYNWLADSGRLRVFDLLGSLQKVKAVHRERLFSPNLLKDFHISSQRLLSLLVGSPSAQLSAEPPQKTHVGSAKQIYPQWGPNDQHFIVTSFLWTLVFAT